MKKTDAVVIVNVHQPERIRFIDSWTYGPLSGSSLVIKAGKAIEM